jgi:hypothetical protein
MRPECWKSQGSLSCSPWKSLPWMKSYRFHTQLYARLWKYLSNYSKLVHLCLWILFNWYQKLKVLCMVVFRDEGTFEPTTEMLSRERRPIPWPGRSCDFTLLDIFWSNVTDHIYIPPFGIPLMEGNTEIEHILRPTPFLDCMQYKLVIPFRCLGITVRFHLQGSRCQRRTCLDSRQPARTWCLLKELTVNELIEWHLIFRGDMD